MHCTVCVGFSVQGELPVPHPPQSAQGLTSAFLCAGLCAGQALMSNRKHHVVSRAVCVVPLPRTDGEAAKSAVCYCAMASRTAEYVPKTKKKAPKANKAKQPSTSALFHAKPFCLRRIWMTQSGGTT